jgi:rare lipoprotein A
MKTTSSKFAVHALLVSALGAVSFAARAETGLAAVYSHRLDGHKTASGKIYKPSGMTVAHKSLPFGTVVQITNKSNGKTAKATVTDRGPMQAGRVLDVSPAVAHSLGMKRGAMTEVEVEKE